MAHYDINDMMKRFKRAQEITEARQQLKEQQRKETLKEAYKIIYKKKAFAEVKEIFDDIIAHPDSGQHLKNTLRKCQFPTLPELTPAQEMEVKVAHLTSVFGVNNDAAEQKKIRAMLQETTKYGAHGSSSAKNWI